jgi:hypothetical protein
VFSAVSVSVGCVAAVVWGFVSVSWFNKTTAKTIANTTMTPDSTQMVAFWFTNFTPYN